MIIAIIIRPIKIGANISIRKTMIAIITINAIIPIIIAPIVAATKFSSKRYRLA
jgi:hypothetical protein